MDIKNKRNGEDGEFYMEGNGVQVGVMHYVLTGSGKMVIDHTEVDETFEGKGYGRQLVKAGVAFARKNKLKIVPQCPFAKKVFDITPEFTDVLF